MKKTLGGDRLGAGKKMEVDLHGYGKSTHNLNRVWRSTMTTGTLIPFIVEPTLNGDDIEIDLTSLVRTLPTNGPIFGSFKLQLDVFSCPIRLYIAALHNNKLGIGMNMKNVFIPQMELKSADLSNIEDGINRQQINPSSLLAYIGQRGLGRNTETTGSIINGFKVKKNALALLMYYDIFKNYYSNKQEGIGYVIDANAENGSEAIPQIQSVRGGTGTITDGNFTGSIDESSTWMDQLLSGTTNADQIIAARLYNDNVIRLQGEYLQNIDQLNILTAKTYNGSGTTTTVNVMDPSTGWNVAISTSGRNIYIQPPQVPGQTTFVANIVSTNDGAGIQWTRKSIIGKVKAISQFDLSNIDDMREQLLQASTGSAVTINELEAGASLPYNAAIGEITGIGFAMGAVMENAGICLKTYLSDRFNNWLNTEWIDGPDGITAITSIDTSEGSFSMDTLNLAQKIYNLLNRVAVSGGSYEDWQEAVWGVEALRRAESPIYCGGMSAEITFDEVVSTADATALGNDQPLGSLAGRGNDQSHKGGSIHIETREPSYIMGIISITPRVDYYQGNKWWTRLKTMDDWHKPELDGIGFQELITDELAAFDTQFDPDTEEPIYKSAGKQPAWIQYMTSQNEVYGAFADPDKEMFMTLVRRYEKNEDGSIADLTTYIDPTKYNYAFANNALEQQNFWVQVGISMKARRKMSARIMPNL